MVNFSIMIPLLEVLFNQVDYNLTHNNLNNNEFNFSIEYIKTSFYTYFNEIIQTKGRKDNQAGAHLTCSLAGSLYAAFSLAMPFAI